MKKTKKLFNMIPKEIYLIIFIALILMAPILEYQISYGHDAMFHTTNILGVMNSTNFMKLHLLPCKVFGGEIGFGFGYGTGIFYPPLSYFVSGYIGKLLGYIHIDRNYAITLTQLLVLIASGITMYIFMNKITKGNKKVASLSAISYMCTPYFLADIYQRTAMGEMFIFVFVPLVFLGLYDLFYEEKYKEFYISFVIGYVGCILSHLLLSVFLTIFIVVLFLINYKKVLKWKYIYRLAISSIFILLMTSYYILPMLEHRLFGSYVVFGNQTMYSDISLIRHSLHIGDLFSLYDRNLDGVNVYFNFIVFAMAVITVINYKKIFKTEKEKKIFITLFVLLLLSIFSSSRLLLWTKLPAFLKTIQFPWRLVAFISFAISALSGYAIKTFENKESKLAYIILAILVVSFGFNSIDYSTIKSAQLKHQINLGYQLEYLPFKAKNNKGYLKSRDKNIKVISGDVDIDTRINKAPYLLADIKLKSKNAIVELPRLYYLGYKITLKDIHGNSYDLDYEEDKYGFIKTNIPSSGELEIKYKGTKIYKISLVLSLSGTIGLIAFVSRKKYK